MAGNGANMNYESTDLADWAASQDAANQPGVSMDGLDEPLPEGEEGEGEEVEGGDPCEALRAVQSAIERLDAVELPEGADEKLVKRLDDLRDELEDAAKEAGELADDVEKAQKDAEDEEPDEDEDEAGGASDDEDEPDDEPSED